MREEEAATFEPVRVRRLSLLFGPSKFVVLANLW